VSYLPSFPTDFTPLMAFGLILLIGSLGGFITHLIPWLPSITGFMAVGFFFGPSGINILSQETLAQAGILIHIALGLILYRLGLSLDMAMLRHNPSLLLVSLVESVATFCLVTYILSIFDVGIATAALVGAITVSSSPAVLLHVANEVGASGKVTESTETLVALNNLISFTLFSFILPFMHYTVGSHWVIVILQPLYQLLGSLLLGIILGWCLHFMVIKTRQAGQYRLALVIGTIMLGVGFAKETQLSMLLIPLVVGVTAKSIERENMVSELAFGPAFELFFIVLFVFAGAKLHVRELIEFAPAVFALVVARTFAKTAGVAAATVLLRKPLRYGISSGLLIVPMAGLAIGLADTSCIMFMEHASLISAMVLGAVTMFETIGPPVAAFAFRFSGESSAASVR